MVDDTIGERVVSITELREDRWAPPGARRPLIAPPPASAPARSAVAGEGLRGKRAFDLLLGVPLCLLALPVVAVLAVLVAVQLRANPFFVHDRIGTGGRTVAIPKLRTLSPGTPRYADKTVVDLAPPTRLTAALRRTHLDELPQLLLVLTGQLSLVGPRPRMAGEALEHGDVVYEVLRTSVPQGCTGLWQVSEGRTDRVSDHPAYDVFYVANRTARLDLWILWRTALQTLGKRPVGLDDVPAWALDARPAPTLVRS